MSFKLLAIRPLKGCSRKFLKNLQVNQIYKFYAEAKFYSANEERIDDKISDLPVRTINFDETEYLPHNFFDNEKVSISAIVGKNGSGKSALIELFIVAINQLAARKIKEKELNSSAELQFLNKSGETVCCEIYYLINQKYYILNINRGIVELIELKSRLQIDLTEFFYTSILNYSIHSFNSSEAGQWIDKLFHKNDSYQIPVVLNPKREAGNYSGIIDINNENYLLHQRLISILVKNQFLSITENLIVDHIKLKLKDSRSFTILNTNSEKKITKFGSEKRRSENFFNVLEDQIGFIFTTKLAGKTKFYFNLKSLLTEFKKRFEIYHISLGTEQYRFDIYILYKIVSICEKYHSFRKCIVEQGKDKNYEYLIINTNLFLNKFIGNNSHILLKLKQVINYYKEYDRIWRNVDQKLSLSHLKEIQPIINEEFLDHLPPPTFDISFMTKDNVDILKSISSGERQMIYTLTSIIYHIVNINSVNSFELIKYRNVNVILDEIELYFHPEFQRKFIERLLDILQNVKLDSIEGLNFLIITHSPFILSDIPKQNILFLESKEGVSKPIEYKSDNTFAENIHEILNNGFFLSDTKGAFSRGKIESFLKYYEKTSKEIERDLKLIEKYKAEYFHKRKSFVKLINLIGEDYIRTVLKNHLSQLDRILWREKSIEETEKEIEKLQEQLKKMKENGENSI